jgi:hypothetical protein
MKQKLVVQRTTDPASGKVKEQDLFDLFYTPDGKRIVLQWGVLDKKWTCPGQNAAVLQSDGNGFDITLGRGKDPDYQKIRLDYSAADFLRLLLTVERRLRNQNKAKSIGVEKDHFVNRLKDLDAKEKKRLRRLGDVISDLEDVVQEMVGEHDLQWGDILSLVHGYLRVHNPGAQEEYVDGGSPEFYYGPKREE